MTKLVLITMALSAINGAWSEKVTSEFKNIEQSALDEIATNFEKELVEIQPSELEIRINEFIKSSAKAIFIPIDNKFPSMKDVNKDTLAEISASLLKALTFEEKPAASEGTTSTEAIGEKLQEVEWFNGDGIEVRGLPTFNSTPTVGEELTGVKFNPNGLSLNDAIHSKIANVVDVLLDLGKVSENETQRANIDNALFIAKELAKSVGVCFVV
jgi:hypothetical protein